MTKPIADGLIDEPGSFDTRETWERHLAEVEKLPDSPARDAAIRTARKMISMLGGDPQ